MKNSFRPGRLSDRVTVFTERGMSAGRNTIGDTMIYDGIAASSAPLRPLDSCFSVPWSLRESHFQRR